MFPEISFSRYCLDKQQALEFSEKAGEGQNYLFAKEIALKINSYVIVGYVEKEGDKLYNSAIVVDRSGKVIGNHRKKLLYESDKKWCSEGDSMTDVSIINTDGEILRMGVAICMDINYKDFVNEQEYELADYLKFK